MNDAINEKDYPVQLRWILKPVPGLLVPFIILCLILILGLGDIETYFYVLFTFIYAPIYVVYAAIRRATFHYSIDSDFLTIRQGIISKEQRHIPYAVIQHTSIKQDILDRLLGLSSLMIENASLGAGSQQQSEVHNQKVETLGFSGNRVSIPGLSNQDAQLLQSVILKKVFEHPVDDNQSGL